nr:hypothetical protein [Tanacetum cinerariifolium]
KGHKKKHHDDEDDDDEDPPAGPNQGKKTKRKRTKESESSKKPSTTKETPKGKTPTKGSKTGKTASIKELIKEPIAEVIMDDAGDDVDPLTFNDLMATPIDFSMYVLNILKIDNLTQDILLGPAFNLLKGHRTVVVDYFFNNDLEYLKTSDPEVSKFSKQNVYSTKAILGVKSVSVKKLHEYGHLEEIVVKRSDQQLYKFKEGNLVDLHLTDIEDMLLLVVQHKLFHLDGNVIVEFIVALRMFTRSLILKRRVEDLQLGVESYQKKLNITKPHKTFPKNPRLHHTIHKELSMKIWTNKKEF